MAIVMAMTGRIKEPVRLEHDDDDDAVWEQSERKALFSVALTGSSAPRDDECLVQQGSRPPRPTHPF